MLQPAGTAAKLGCSACLALVSCKFPLRSSPVPQPHSPQQHNPLPHPPSLRCNSACCRPEGGAASLCWGHTVKGTGPAAQPPGQPLHPAVSVAPSLRCGGSLAGPRRACGAAAEARARLVGRQEGRQGRPRLRAAAAAAAGRRRGGAGVGSAAGRVPGGSCSHGDSGIGRADQAAGGHARGRIYERLPCHRRAAGSTCCTRTRRSRQRWGRRCGSGGCSGSGGGAGQRPAAVHLYRGKVRRAGALRFSFVLAAVGCHAMLCSCSTGCRARLGPAGWSSDHGKASCCLVHSLELPFCLFC